MSVLAVPMAYTQHTTKKRSFYFLKILVGCDSEPKKKGTELRLSDNDMTSKEED